MRSRKVVRYGARIFELYGAKQENFLNYARVISVANNGGRWRFWQSGEPLAHEDPSWYSARVSKDKFQEEQLAELLAGIGLFAFDESFYAREGTLIELHGPTAHGLQEYELSEARKGWGD